MRRIGFVLALGVFAAGSAVNAQIQAKMNGSAVTHSVSSNVLTIQAGTITSNAVIHVYDAGTSSVTGPTLSLEGIVLQASLNGAPSGTWIKLIVGNEDTETDFQALPTTEMFAGVVNFGTSPSTGSITFDGTGGTSDDQLRDATVLAMAVSGDVYATIDVGRVYRVQALTNTGSTLGLIKGNITAHANDDITFLPSPANPLDRELGEYAINVITAARGIEGKVQSKTGAIARVQVTGVTTGVVGIANDIISAKDIASVFSAGPLSAIGGGPIKIYAAGNIEQVRTIDSSGNLVTENGNVHVRTGVDEFGGLLNGFKTIDQTGTEANFTGTPGEDGALGLLEIGGDATVNLSVVNLAPTPANTAGRVGILCRGILIGNIDILYNLEHSRIIAETFAPDENNGILITIGNRMTGVIIENTRSPFITSAISIGMGISKPVAYREMIDGMTGINCPPVDMASGNWPFTMADCDGKTFDSLIRFGTLKGLAISRMTLETALAERPAMDDVYDVPAGNHKAYMPRVEVLLADEMGIDAMEAGVVWSGNLLQSGVPDTDTTNDYMNGGDLTIGCVSPTADLWVGNWDKFDVTHDVLGEIHVPRVRAPVVADTPIIQYIRIGERLADFLEADRLLADDHPKCLCGSTQEYNNPSVDPCELPINHGLTCTFPCPLTPSGGESSPRAFSGGDKFAMVGRVHVREQNQLVGNVVVNANNLHEYPDCPTPPYSASSFWTGKIEVKRSSTLESLLQPTGYLTGGCCYSAQPVHAVSVNLYGGGDAGEVPFRIHTESSVPPYARSCTDANLGGWISAQALAADYATTTPSIRIRYDGPVQVQAGTLGLGSLARVFIVNSGGWIGSEVTEMFSYSVDPAEPRELRLTPREADASMYVDPTAAVRRYRVFVERGESAPGVPADFYERLICHPNALLLTSGSVAVSTETFDFRVFPDCNGNSEVDPEEIESLVAVGTVIDCDRNGLIDSCEISADPDLDLNEDGYLDACQNGCDGLAIGDFNCDSAFNGDDIFEFLEVFFAYLGLNPPFAYPQVDADLSGTVQWDDLFAFYQAWINQCPCDN